MGGHLGAGGGDEQTLLAPLCMGWVLGLVIAIVSNRLLGACVWLRSLNVERGAGAGGTNAQWSAVGRYSGAGRGRNGTMRFPVKNCANKVIGLRTISRDIARDVVANSIFLFIGFNGQIS